MGSSPAGNVSGFAGELVRDASCDAEIKDMSRLLIGDSLSLPRDVMATTQAIVAQKGAGKTYLAMKMMEEAVKAGLQSIAMDPTGVWYGLSASGDGPALPVLVMGGEHGNVPLESTSGEVVAEFIVDSGRSVVLDLSLMRKAEMHRFMAAFLDKLYHYKATHRENLHVFFDEADTAAPQSPGPEQARVLGAAEDVVRRGRSRGLGMTLITQRPAVLNKNLLEMCDTLYIMRVIGANDQDAIRKRVGVDAPADQVKTMMASLASLENGEAWIWSPGALSMFKRFRVGAKQTFDSGRSPKPGERVVQPKTRAEIDLNDLTAKIKATVEKSKENDPKLLRAEVAKLRAELAKKSPAPSEPRMIEMIVEVPVLKNGQLDRTEKFAGRLEQAGEALMKEAAELRRMIAPAAVAVNARSVAAARHAPAVKASVPARIPRVQGQVAEKIGKCERAILTALAQYPAGRAKNQIGVLTGYAVGGGGFNNSVSSLRSRSYIAGDGDQLKITDSGADALGVFTPLPHGAALLQHWKKQLGKAEWEILDALAAVWPQSLGKEDVAARTESRYAANGGGFNNAISRLRTLELIGGKTLLKASDDLFD